MKSLTTLQVSPCTVWFQCEFEFACSAPNTIGSTCGPPPAHSDGPAVCQLREAGRARGGAAGASARCCAMSETMYSLFHRKRARSATWKCGDSMQRDTCAKSGAITAANSRASTISNTSSSSFSSSTSFGECVHGQNLRIASRTGLASFGSFSTNCETQYESCWWYMPMKRTLWSGSSARCRKSMCSSLSGSAKPLMIEPRISRSSAMPLCRSVSYTKV
mmetsp:Transcript_23012/g.65868  ORF Transcript_23012/g.65868 Transcript_23012/m.65868 type:complete len:219 (+) Transcript_23012:451-1107(+)